MASDRCLATAEGRQVFQLFMRMVPICFRCMVNFHHVVEFRSPILAAALTSELVIDKCLPSLLR